jgi:PAS domain S-box-containing protein
MPKKDEIRSQVLPAPTEAILESISDGVFTVDLQWRITSFNRAAEEITGIARTEAIGRLCSDVFRSSMCESKCALRQTLKSGNPVIGKSGFIIDADGSRLPVSVSTAVLKERTGHVIGGAETFRDMSEVEALQRERIGRFRIGDLVSHSALMQQIFDLLPAVSASPSTVLICGETGTGKELIARTIHDLSPRRKRAFVAVNCAALPDTLLESELFGYKAGAFTGATKNKPGRFALAHGGTLFLDEMAEISPALQAKLLRVLQDHQFEPLGATKTERADVRIIGATNKDLSDEMRKGNFRQDLYYRVNVVRIDLPPLRKRLEDVPILVKHFIGRFNRQQEKSIEGISSEALSMLMAHQWPGNVRELENIIERAFILCSAGEIGLEDLPEELVARRSVHHPLTRIETAREIVDAQSIRAALERNGHNRLAAARDLGIHKSTLFRKIKKLGIVLPDTDGRSRQSLVSH